MSTRIHRLVAASTLLVTSAVNAEAGRPLPDVYRIGGYYGDDSSYAATLSGDWAVLDASRATFGGAYINAQGTSTDLSSYQLHGGFEYAPSAWQLGVEAEYRNDETTGIAFAAEDTIATLTARLRGTYQTDRARASLAIGRRKIELELDLPDALRRFVDTHRETFSTEYALSLRFTSGAFAAYANGSYYEYDDPIQSLVGRGDDPRIPVSGRPLLQDWLQRVRESLARLDFATIRLANNFLDYSATLGADYSIGEHQLNLEGFRQRVTGDGTTIDGLEAGWVIPTAATSDLELRVGGVYASSEWLPYGSLTISFYH